MLSNFFAVSGSKISSAAVKVHDFINSSVIVYVFFVFAIQNEMKHEEEICL